MISVIIPFYNAIDFILQSVKSAAKHEIVSEIIVIYDGCPYISFLELESLLFDLNKVNLIHHEGYKNCGSGASRNLGVKMALNKWIAFLDADDFFLENRFYFFQNALGNNYYFDGLYEAVMYNNDSKRLYTVSKADIEPSKLLHFLIRGTYGHFHTNGLIVKKDLLLKAGLFNETLMLHQDSELWLKLAYYGILKSGNISTPVSMVRIHKGNRVWEGANNDTRLKQWIITLKWAWNKPVGLINKLLIIRKIFRYKFSVLK